jgi:hypothetical protein
VARVALLRRGVPNHRALDEVAGVGRHAADEHDVPARAERSTSFSATGGVGAVGCSSGAPNGLLLNRQTGICFSARSWRRANARASCRQRPA